MKTIFIFFSMLKWEFDRIMEVQEVTMEVQEESVEMQIQNHRRLDLWAQFGDILIALDKTMRFLQWLERQGRRQIEQMQLCW